ncbi:bifunctional alpha/beta hydrolase/OsmC family protein [Salegentibacter chungangensis]|uniref:Alpha/beta fold hydrolase n=1 Tax=Salegentibacter chungangensis TaxID=1335724 RepID=A0ABW3NT59_9FLAO
MKKTKVEFSNPEGESLSGIIELPTNQKPHNFVLFAHCFTCNKNFFAPTAISRAMASAGFGVLRFDFTGLGESEGEFADSNFSGNIEDLVAAADFLEKEYKAPSVLIGHSLGGAAVLFAAEKIKSVKAVATLAAPSAIDHVTKLLKSEIKSIQEKGSAEVNIGGRPFRIKEQFIEDIKSHKLADYMANFNKALLIMHSPQDMIVNIKNAEELYVAAEHPKSFISLEGADHLLQDKKDAAYAGKVISAWASRYLDLPKEKELKTDHEVVANLGNEGYTTQIKAGIHNLTADEPESAGGNDYGPTPYEFLSSGLAACTSMTIQMYVKRKEWDLENVETHVTYEKKHADDCENCEEESSKIDTFNRQIKLEGNLDEKQIKRILNIANKCPVHRTLSSKITINTSLLED